MLWIFLQAIDQIIHRPLSFRTQLACCIFGSPSFTRSMVYATGAEISRTSKRWRAFASTSLLQGLLTNILHHLFAGNRTSAAHPYDAHAFAFSEYRHHMWLMTAGLRLEGTKSVLWSTNHTNSSQGLDQLSPHINVATSIPSYGDAWSRLMKKVGSRLP